MDYTLQIENLYKFFALSLSAQNMCTMLEIKRKFQNDLNLLGCFIKDFLILENNGIIPQDKNLYNDFVIYYEKNLINLDEILKKLKNYSSYYISIVFEEVENKKILGFIETINACFALDAYPCLIKILDEYYNQKADSNKIYKMLELLTELVIKRIENPNLYDLNLLENMQKERLAS